MSQLLDLADKMHGGQMSAATHVQKIVLKSLTRVAGLADKAADKAPDAPERVVRPLRKVAGPVAGVVGTPADFATYLTRATREWAELNLTFQAAAYDAVVGTTLAPAKAPLEGESGSAGAPALLKASKPTKRTAASSEE